MDCTQFLEVPPECGELQDERMKHNELWLYVSARWIFIQEEN
jgi:hypothetical protein